MVNITIKAINDNVISHLSQNTNRLAAAHRAADSLGQSASSALTVDSLREVCYTGFSSAKEKKACLLALLDQPKEPMLRLLPLDSPRDAYK